MRSASLRTAAWWALGIVLLAAIGHLDAQIGAGDVPPLALRSKGSSESHPVMNSR